MGGKNLLRSHARVARWLCCVLLATSVSFGASPTVSGSERQTAPSEKEIILRFPEDRSLGMLISYLPGDQHSYQTVDARGEQRRPAGSHLGLELSQPACQEIARLRPLVSQGIDTLYLRDLELEPQAIEALASLAGIRDLDISSCELRDADLATLARLSTLRKFTLNSMPITDAGIAHLEGLPLEGLSLLRTKATDRVWQSVAKLNKLKSLRLANPGMSDSGFSSFEKLPDLESLSLELSSISDAGMAQLAKLSMLRSLSFEGRGIRINEPSFLEISKLQRLERLDLSNLRVDGATFAKLKPLERLRELRLPPGMDDRALASLGEFKKLEQLSCSSSKVTDDGVARIAQIQRLQSLSLMCERVTNRGIQELAKATKLKGLDLQGCQVDDQGLEQLAALPSLESLHLSNVLVSGDGLRHLQRFPALTGLSLWGLTDKKIELRHLARIPKLAHLTIDGEGADFDESELDQFANLPELRELEFSGTALSDSALHRLLTLPALEVLRLDTETSRLTDVALGHVARMKTLQQLTIGGDFSDVGLGLLENHPTLRHLTIVSHALTETGIAKLRKTLTVDAPLMSQQARERAAEFFTKRAPLANSLQRARDEARRERMRVLLVWGNPELRLTQRLVQAFEQQDIYEALRNYERVAVALNDREELSAALPQAAATLATFSSPAILVLDETGQIAGVCRIEDRETIDLPVLLKFLDRHAPEYDAEALLAAGLKQAQRENKRVLLKQTGAYCGGCRKLSKFLEEQGEFFQAEYVIVPLDSGRFAHGRDVARRYRPRGGLIPWIAILDQDGSALATSDGPHGAIGFPSDQAAIDHFMGMLEKTARHSGAELTGKVRTALETRIKMARDGARD